MATSAKERKEWTAVGSDATAQRTYASIRKALESVEAARNVEIFLQGSYANATNIRADSDVDVVVMTKKTFQSNAASSANPAIRGEWDRLPEGTYKVSDLRTDVIAALTAYYGGSVVEPKNKCIKVRKRSGFLDADVVPCLQYRHLTAESTTVHSGFAEGISLKPVIGDRIINYPKEHIANGQAKNSLCGGHYKKTVRQVKRLRNRAVNEGLLPDGVAPGYLLECMVFNAPDQLFEFNDGVRLRSVVNWMRDQPKSTFLSCDQIHTLFNTDPGRFSASLGDQVANALAQAY